MADLRTIPEGIEDETVESDPVLRILSRQRLNERERFTFTIPAREGNPRSGQAVSPRQLTPEMV